MTQPARVIYLPPGVVAGAPAAQQVAAGGVPFDRSFFQQVLPAAVAAFCQQVDCNAPLVEILTVDGARHYVKGIAGVADLWVALHTAAEDHERAVEAFIPYQTIFRVEIHPCGDEKRHLGFITTPAPSAEEETGGPVARNRARRG